MARSPWRFGKIGYGCCQRLSLFWQPLHEFLFPRESSDKLKILICVPCYGYTGGAFAILSVTDLLSESCDVSFLTKPSNVMNKYVSREVRMVGCIAGKYDYCVIESGTDDAIVAKVERDGARIILAMHGAPSAA